MKTECTKTLVLCVMLSLLSCNRAGSEHGTAGTNDAASVPPTPADGTTPLFAIYMVGGEVEDSVLVPGDWAPDENHHLPAGEKSPFGAGSDDLRELAEGYRSMSEQNRKKFRAWVAFGGANKADWHGIKYADLPCLAADAEDEIFGNAHCYAAREASDTSTPETLTRFLSFVGKTRATDKSNAPVSVLVLWGQGGAYRGVFHDSVTQEVPFMTLPQLGQSLSQSGARFDVIGFDSGMMAALEVADTLRPFGRYMVASPDTVPSHGFDYRALLRALSEPASSLDIAKGIADAFIQGKSITFESTERERRVVDHEATSGKSISVIDLEQTSNLTSKLELFTKATQAGFAFVSSALADAPNYGRDPRLNALYGVDILGLANRSKSMVADFAVPADELTKALQRAVIYARQDASKPEAGGLSVFTPMATRLWTATYEAGKFLSLPWHTWSAAFVERAQRDSQAPVLRLRKTDKSERILEAKDDLALFKIESLRAKRSPDSPVLRVWGSTPPTVLERGDQGRTQLVRVSAWDGRGHWLCSGPCSSTSAVRVPTHFEGVLRDGSVLYSTSMVVRDFVKKSEGQPAVLFMRAPAAGPILDAWFVLLKEDTNGDVMFYRQQRRLQRGLSLGFYVLEHDPSQNTQSYELTEFLNLEQSPEWRFFQLDEDPTTLGHFVLARDLNRNIAASAFFPATRRR